MAVELESSPLMINFGRCHVGIFGAVREDQPVEGAACQEALRGVGQVELQRMAETRRDSR